MYKILVLPQQIMQGYFTSGSYIRLIHPLQRLIDKNGGYKLIVSESYDGGEYDAVFIERIFREDVDTDELCQLINRLRRSGTKVFFAIDDNYYDHLVESHGDHNSLRQLSVVCLLARKADAVICSTEALAAILKSFNQNVHLFPNFLSRQYLKRSNGVLRGHGRGNDTLDIGYMGTLTHLADFRIVANALKSVMNEYPNARLHLVQIGDPDELKKAMQPYEVIIHKAPHLSCLYEVFFPWYVKNIRWDIGLAPLANTQLNHCKSDLKLLDYAAIGAAGIYTRITPYADIEKNGMGVVVDNTDEDWYAGIKKLIDDVVLRSRIQKTSQQYLMEERVLEDNVDLLDEIMQQVMNR